MKKQQICNAINLIDAESIFNIILRGGNGHSREDRISDEIKDKLNQIVNNNIFQTRQGLNQKVIDLVELNNNQIANVLEAKHYSTMQSKDLGYFIFESAGGPASDSLKLKSLGFENHFLIQYTSQITSVTGEHAQIYDLSQLNEFKFLTYLFDNNNLNWNKINNPLKENWVGQLHDFFIQTFDEKTNLVTRECNKFINEHIRITLLFHCFVMEVTSNNKLINRYR